MTRTKSKPAAGRTEAGAGKTGIYASSDTNYTLNKNHCQVCHLVGQAAILAYKSWLAGHFRKAAAHNAVFAALLDLAARREGA
jgi:hypothetical protein